ncbi:MAG TPA: protein translocase subunit SecDF [Planctomycetaceae bacterium]|nr:protein translocase subunit SecDF [Planctomycetaceae bacterium]
MDLLLTNVLTTALLLGQAEDGSASAAATAVGNAAEASAWQVYGINIAIVLAIFVLPFIISHFVTRAVRMPSHSTRVGFMLATIFAALIFGYQSGFQLPPSIEMKGGTILVYGIKPNEGGQPIKASALSSSLNTRLNPSGTQDMLIRPMGESQIEIIVPETDPMALATLKERLQKSGALEFRIVANFRDHSSIIDKARAQAAELETPVSDVVDDEGKVIARWYRVGRDAKKNADGVYALRTDILRGFVRNPFTGQIITQQELAGLTGENSDVEKFLIASGNEEVDLLMAFQRGGRDYAVVLGDDLSNAQETFNQQTGNPEISFSLGGDGSLKMSKLTGLNNPDADGFKRQMAIIMDKKVMSAPELNSTISSQGVIQGRFTIEEVSEVVNILRSGRLPATLSDEPISQETIGAGLGESTITKGTTASLWAVVATFACILVYYRFAGMVASLALVINGLLIFGIMILIQQPLTLAGLAGLVLTVGMSVDANVLIFERIREEKNKGSAPRMSIRNGFDRAFTTIIDSNLTTLIAAIVLYWIGTEQVRGFAVALIIGIMTSMFTATFCSRIIFEICEKLKMVSLSMSDGVGLIKDKMLGVAEFNFMGFQKLSLVVSITLITAGIAAVVLRGKDLLNIDFTGGTSVVFQLTQAAETEQLRQITQEILVSESDESPVQSTLVKIEKEPVNTVYRLVTSLQDPDELAKRVINGFKENQIEVITYEVEYSAAPTGASLAPRSKFKFVSLQEDPPAEAAAGTDVDAAPTEQDEGEGATTGEKETGEPEAAAPSLVTSVFEVNFGGSDGEEAEYSGPTLVQKIQTTAKDLGITMNDARVSAIPSPRPSNWTPEDSAGYPTWKVSMPVSQSDGEKILATIETELASNPKWLSLSRIQGRVASEMQNRAIGAILVSLIFIVAYIWFRFQKVAYGLAAVVALVHDVLITLGVIALCHWLSGPLGFLMIEDFKIGLTEVAAFLTIIGYSLNDTIVVFDRIREVRGRSPRLTPEMVNTSVNQTLSRTLLTSGTTLLTVLLLYIFGGEGIHAFAFALLIGVLVGTYSSIFVASPVLLWITNREAAKKGRTATA